MMEHGKAQRRFALPAIALFFLGTGCAIAGPLGDYTVEWPKERQHELAGHFVGTLRNEDCERMTADLLLTADYQYTLATRCKDQGAREHVIQGQWWVDEIAGSCLVLMANSPPNDKGEALYGFRIDETARKLSLRGGQCTSADPRDDSHSVKRID